jgi:RNA polymerase sigma-70 factor, ECF subfamily
VMRPPKDSLRDAFVAAIPYLKAFAFSLCRDSPRADDLVQETLVKGWQKRASFEAGTNLKAWLFTILRNNYFSELRKKKNHRLVEANGDQLSQRPTQPGHLDLQDFAAALDKLELPQREALILVGAKGFSYEEAAQISDCAVGTIKSRVNRARRRLAAILQISDGPAATYEGVITRSPLIYRRQ